MIKIFSIILALLISLSARENPFFADKNEKDIIVSSNHKNEKEPLKRATITLPSEARILKKVTIEYQNLDGSIDKKSIKLDNSVDWHLPIFISQNYNESKSNNPIKHKKIKNYKSKYKRVAAIKYASFHYCDKNLKIITKDKMIRNFYLVKPARIVMDFKRDSTMKSFSKAINKPGYKSIRIGNHDGYYRVVVELDGLYKYTKTKLDNGYLLELK